jgi:hypothetical protein
MSHNKLRSFTCVIQPFRYTSFYVICVLFYFNKIVFKFISCTISLANPIQRTPQRFNIKGETWFQVASSDSKGEPRWETIPPGFL